MSDAAARAQRAAALEEKRRRLEELKARRERRDQTIKQTSSANLDEYIDGLLKNPVVGPPIVAAEASDTPALVEEKQKADSLQNQQSNNVIAEAKGAPAQAVPVAPVKKVVTFEFGTQTEAEDFPIPPTPEAEGEEGPEDVPASADLEATVKEEVKQEEKAVEAKVLSSEEVEQEVTSEPFSVFLSTASKKVERVLGAPLLADLLVDYVGEMDGVERANKSVSDGSRFLASRQVYESSKWTANRNVTDVDWSPLHRELMLSVYEGASRGSSAAVQAVAPPEEHSSSALTPRSGELQADGLALVWSLAMPNRPEHIFTCGSPVLAGRFHPTEAPLMIGGCQSGQLVVWDVRAGRLPVQRSALTTGGTANKGHAFPICSMEIIEGGAGLVTAATDGRVNFWSMANLRDPVESLQIGDSASCFTVAPESESLLFGDGSGALHAVQSSNTQGQRSSKRPVRKLDSNAPEGDVSLGHFGMVTAVATKSITKGSSLRGAGLSKGFLRGSGGLVLTSGVDWSVKLWAPAYADTPLTSWVSHSYDYMSDVKWSPTHPSLFATASSSGSIGLWNLATSLEEPLTGVDGIKVDSDAGLNKLKWSADGRRMVVASGGKVHVLSLTEEVVRQKGDEDARVMSHLISRGMLERE